MTSNHHAPYGLGYTRATMAQTEGGEPKRGSESQKRRPSSDCGLQPDRTKPESLVIADQNAAVNTFPGLVHTARHTMGVRNARSLCANPSDGRAARERWLRSVLRNTRKKNTSRRGTQALEK